ncbi:hypothetical protein PPYR_12973 [Photinus pyralis]|uniref:Superoxide dismutase n=1 Tax=Photinus pyralis TaxID=7054 RepID=A0A1Y1LRX0_PHOPY|nr:superoxide dismutase [Mn], mitochondrial-like [Photinus pyralis]XP_031354663.1 superoxide dismutase [Mn], mitochondrial-like [Photinus pyralis]XP_031354822.1 superoxide dismutase [Mn], mitochondrial-like [Photinus pyralis]KAB0793352.1 hypothetical protein PPYR_12972 [Photinus pyralis]KAB0793353.1 hypothetical protein PPYR_12973 [Photinus pyralis]
MFGKSFRHLSTVLKTQPIRTKHELPQLPYSYEALEPIISRDIMMLHHQKHHQTYVTNLNLAEEKLRSAAEKHDITAMISLQPAVKFNGGGHINHSIFWQNLSPNQTKASDELCQAMVQSFGSFDKFKDDLSAATVAIQGSGWGWLGYCTKTHRLKIATCANQDPLQATTGLVPLFGIDVWEHAYYLQYKNVRPDYVKAVFDIANWKDISERFAKAKATK